MRLSTCSHGIALVATIALASVARADSDGYYCVGPGYIAYQFGLPPRTAHRLYVVRFGNGAISDTTSLILPQFQVHAMRCRADGVDLAAFDSIHVVTFDPSGVLVRTTSTPHAQPGRLPVWGPVMGGNLAQYSEAFARLAPQYRTLVTEPGGREYVLEISAQPDSVRECEPLLTARVIERGRDRREVRTRVLYREWRDPPCQRPSFAPVVGGGRRSANPLDELLDALVLGPHGPTDVSVYTGALRAEFETYLRRADAYRTTRPPVGGGEMRMVDAAHVRYERRIFAIARDAGVTALAVAYVDSLGPCYEWEGSHECPEREATFADVYQAANPRGPLSAFLPLLSAHRWLCTAEAYASETRSSDAARSRQVSVERLAVARASASLLVRSAAARLAQRGRCYAPEPTG